METLVRHSLLHNLSSMEVLLHVHSPNVTMLSLLSIVDLCINILQHLEAELGLWTYTHPLDTISHYKSSGTLKLTEGNQIQIPAGHDSPAHNILTLQRA